MKVAELERRSGLGRHTLRYYEELGLIAVQRGANNYRAYSEQTAQDLEFIQMAQKMGFSLAEIGEILEAKRQSTIDCAQGAALVADKMAEIELKISHLKVLHGFLDKERLRLEASALALGQTVTYRQAPMPV
ncbi:MULTISPECIES: MerR family transcriptional regulator [Pseudomonas]|uniref:MerR family transcriptional regulator n=1 Tax=Pseudomonas TaxID=286 RepID=UPI000CF2FF7C|nr:MULTISPECIES: MerR family transcriptional regulator [Pseudomonas]TDR48307.1 MerR family transcriptional regulator [Pseudomonas brenneri]MDF3163282.1 MerR family transcriptional regulator [Pseudomonas proteolytica]NMY97565.1 MerR family transcriptional regulator [Pseudomonas proteolytica]NMZ02609.1 MerR family transcriptional regulator [Pseudomonas proteolytica]NMZ42337.1 MerR family transcriptional regulator [Pseudomonas proteolytica]